MTTSNVHSATNPRRLAIAVTLALGTSLFIVPASARDAVSSQTGAPAKIQTQTTSAATHVSGRKHVKQKPKVKHTAAVPVAPPRPVWTGPDPTKGPGIERLRQLQREGRCVIDEGYGRFTYCTDR